LMFSFLLYLSSDILTKEKNRVDGFMLARLRGFWPGVKLLYLKAVIFSFLHHLTNFLICTLYQILLQ
jgi:hypothetical protein